MKKELKAGFLAACSVLFGLGVFFMHGSTARAIDLPVVYVSGTLSTDQTWSAANAYFITGQLTIPNGRTLTIPAGTVVKTNYHTNGIKVDSGGVLQVNGSTSSRVIFTSYRDDSIGGDTNGDGLSAAQDFDFTAISGEGGTVNLAGAEFRHTGSVLTQDCLYNVGSVAATDNVFSGQVTLNRCDQGQTSIMRNQFSMLSGTNNPALNLYNTIPLGIDVTGINKNTFSGTTGRVIRFSTSSDFTPIVPADESWSVDSLGGAILVVDSPKVNGILTLGAGTIVKVAAFGQGFKLGDASNLDIVGTLTEPVTITSLKDDSIGGDSAADGNTTPSSSDFASAIRLPESGVLDATHLKIKYASYPVNMQNGQAKFADTIISDSYTGITVTGGDVIYRGSFDNISERSIRACNWGGACSVDAAYIDWGDVNGPFVPTGTDKVCGSVSVSPWKQGSSTSSATTFQVKNCDNSPTPQDRATDAANAFHQAIANKRIDCDNGYQAACDAIENYLACFGAAIQLAASSSTIPVTFDNATETVDTVGSVAAQAADTAIQAVEVENPQSFSIHVKTKMLGIIGLFGAMYDAYQSCH